MFKISFSGLLLSMVLIVFLLQVKRRMNQMSSPINMPSLGGHEPMMLDPSHQHHTHLTSDMGPDLEPILVGEGEQQRRETFERAYRVGPVLGKGGFGTVYAGERTRDLFPVAIKHIVKSKIGQWCEVSTVYYFRSIDLRGK